MKNTSQLASDPRVKMDHIWLLDTYYSQCHVFTMRHFELEKSAKIIGNYRLHKKILLFDLLYLRVKCLSFDIQMKDCFLKKSVGLKTTFYE